MKKICLLLSCLFVVLLLLSGPMAGPVVAQPVTASSLTAYGDNTLSFDITWGPDGGRVTPWSDSVWVLIDYTDPVSKELKRLSISGATVTAGQAIWPLAKARMVDGNRSGFFVDGQARALGTAATLTLRVAPQAGVTISKPCVYALDYPPLATYGLDGSTNTVALVGTEPFCGIIVNSSGGTMTFSSNEASFTLPAGYRIQEYKDLTGNSGQVDCGVSRPTVTGSSGAVRCGSGVVTLSATPSAGATIDWYSAATGGTLLLSSNTAYSPSVTTSTTYYAQARNTGTQCTSAARTAVVATVSAIPTVTVSSSQTVCFNEAPAALTATSSGGHGSPQVYTWQRSTDGSNWTTVSGSTNTYAPGASTVTNYYRAQVTQTTTGCTSGYSDPATIRAKYCDGPTDSNCSYRTLTIGTTTWAGCNSTYTDGAWFFANQPDTYTPFVQWNNPSKAWPASGAGTMTNWTSGTSTAASWTSHPCPTGWRLPTKDEFQRLDSTGTVWSASGANGNAVAGRFYGSGAGTCSLPSPINCIFLPAAGYRSLSDGALFGQGSDGLYWSSVQVNSTGGYRLNINSSTSNPAGNGSKAVGLSARCVRCDEADCGLPPVITASKGDARCSSSGVVSLTATPSADATIDWYSAASGGTLLHAGSTVYEPSITAATTYYAEARHNSTGRLSTNRTAVVATMYPSFNPGAIAATGQSLCAGGTPALISSATAASGGDGVITYSWYKNGTLIAGATAANYTPPAADAAANTATSTLTITYTRRAKDNTCNTTPAVSTGTWSMDVLRTPPQPTLTAGTLTLCEGFTTTISLPDWYGLPNATEKNYHISGIVWASTANVGAGTYQGQVQSPEGCWSVMSDVVTITSSTYCDLRPCTATTGSMQTIAQTSINTMTTGQTVCLKDDRDNKIYRAVKMPDGRLWMAQNLNYRAGLVHANGGEPQIGSPGSYSIGYYWCYGNSTTACDTYGALYSWETAMSRDGVYGGKGTVTGPTSWNNSLTTCPTGPCSNNANVDGRGICPQNWHVPTDAEWGLMLQAVDGNASHNSNSTGTIGTAGSFTRTTTRGTATDTSPTWTVGNNSTNSTGFSTLPAGYRNYNDGTFPNRGAHGYFWSSSVSSISNAWARRFNYQDDGVYHYSSARALGFSVRCLRD